MFPPLSPPSKGETKRVMNGCKLNRILMIVWGSLKVVEGQDWFEWKCRSAGGRVLPHLP